jgi:hypothetical protein
MESSASAGRVASPVLDPRRWWALALLCRAFFMVLLDGTITIVTRPSTGARLRFPEQVCNGCWAPARSPPAACCYSDSFVGLLLCGLGIGLAFVTATVAALAGPFRTPP